MKCELRTQEETLVSNREDSHSRRSESGDADTGGLSQPAVSMKGLHPDPGR